MMSPKATVAILSIGDMGVGIARLLQHHDYRVITNVSDRSPATQKRAEVNKIDTMMTDEELVNEADYVLSIVPQKDAASVANRIVTAVNSHSFAQRAEPLFFIDLNAVSPQTARTTAELFANSAPMVKLIDGGIISGPPRQEADGLWFRPRLVVSGPVHIDQGPSGKHLADIMNIQHIDDKIGSASALKMCFAAMSKGFAAIAVQSFTTAERFGVADNLQELLAEYNPAFGQAANRIVPAVPPKAYRWVQEMLEISETFKVDGGFPQDLFTPMSQVYSFIAHQTELGKEQTEHRQRGQTVEDVARLALEGLDALPGASLQHPECPHPPPSGPSTNVSEH